MEHCAPFNNRCYSHWKKKKSSTKSFPSLKFSDVPHKGAHASSSSFSSSSSSGTGCDVNTQQLFFSPPPFLLLLLSQECADLPPLTHCGRKSSAERSDDNNKKKGYSKEVRRSPDSGRGKEVCVHEECVRFLHHDPLSSSDNKLPTCRIPRWGQAGGEKKHGPNPDTSPLPSVDPDRRQQADR